AIAIADAIDRAGVERSGVHRVETDAVGTVMVSAAARVAAVGHGLEGDRHTLAGRERRAREDPPFLCVAARPAVGEAQRPLAGRIGQRLRVGAHTVDTPDQRLPVVERPLATLTDRHAAGQLAAGAARGLSACRLDAAGGQARPIEVPPAVIRAGAREVFADGRLCARGERRGERGDGAEDDYMAAANHHSPPRFWTPLATS